MLLHQHRLPRGRPHLRRRRGARHQRGVRPGVQGEVQAGGQLLLLDIQGDNDDDNDYEGGDDDDDLLGGILPRHPHEGLLPQGGDPRPARAQGGGAETGLRVRHTGQQLVSRG